MNSVRSWVVPLRSARKRTVRLSTVKTTGSECAVSAGALAWTATQMEQELEPRARSPEGCACVVSSPTKTRTRHRHTSATQSLRESPRDCTYCIVISISAPVSRKRLIVQSFDHSLSGTAVFREIVAGYLLSNPDWPSLASNHGEQALWPSGRVVKLLWTAHLG